MAGGHDGAGDRPPGCGASSAALTNPTLTGDTLTWEHNDTRVSAQLQP